MSNNTNTLFWVITGAVIILSVFLLINNSQNETLNMINDKFNNYWKETNNQDEHDEPIVEETNIFSFGDPTMTYNQAIFSVDEPRQALNDRTVFAVRIKNIGSGKITPLEYVLHIYDSNKSKILSIQRLVDVPVSNMVTVGNLGSYEIFNYACYWSIDIIRFERI